MGCRVFRGALGESEGLEGFRGVWRFWGVYRGFGGSGGI